MRDLLEPENLLSPGMIRSATTVLTIALAALAAIMLLQALGSLISFKIITALFQVGLAVAVPLSIWLVIRLLTEQLIAQQQTAELMEELLGGDFDDFEDEFDDVDEDQPTVPPSDPVAAEASITDNEPEVELTDTDASETAKPVKKTTPKKKKDDSADESSS